MSLARGAVAPGPRTLSGWFAAVALAALAGVGVERLTHRPPEVPPPPRVRHVRPPADIPRNFTEALARVDRDVADAAAFAAQRPEQWVPLETLARKQAEKGRLTGDFADYAAAQASFDRAFAMAPKGAGPHRAQASLDFTLHRLAAAERMLDIVDHYAVPPDFDERVDNLALRGDIAFYRGDYAGARRIYAKVEAMEPGGVGDLRHAVDTMNTGRPDLALRWLDRSMQAMRQPTPLFIATIEQQEGIVELQRGRWDQAMAHFRRADAAFPGWWSVESYIAQVLALQGRIDAAERMYRDIAARTDNPQVLDALAGLARRRGDAAAAQAWAAQAGAVWRRWLVLAPEAAYAHAAEHELAFGDPARGLDLALKDHAARPYGLTGVALAWAYLANNRPDDALKALAPVQASAWVSPEQHLAAAQAYALLGQADRADAEQQKALALNPHATDPNATLIWFGH